METCLPKLSFFVLLRFLNKIEFAFICPAQFNLIWSRSAPSSCSFVMGLLNLYQRQRMAQEQKKCHLFCVFMTFMSVMSLRRALRARFYLRRVDLISPHHGTPWKHVWLHGLDGGFVSFVGFDRHTFLRIHERFVRQDSVVFKRFLREQAGKSRLVGRPPSCDSYTLLAVGLYYLVNLCYEKVVILLFCVCLTAHTIFFAQHKCR
jgi:hypothetical protein